MNPKNKTIIKIGAIGVIPSLIIPILGTLLVGGYAAYYAIKDENFSTKKERTKVAAKAGLLANAVTIAIFLLGLLILFAFLFLVQSEIAYNGIFALLVLSPFIFLSIILSLIFGAISGAFVGNQFEQFGKTDFFVKAGLGAFVLFGISIVLPFLLLNIWNIIGIANQIILINYGNKEGEVYTPDSGNYSCNFEYTIAGGGYAKDSFDPNTGIGSIEMEHSVFKESLTFYPLDGADISTSTENRLERNSTKVDGWIAEKLIEYPDLLLFKNEKMNEEDVIAVVFLPTEHFSGTYTDSKNGFLTASLFFVRGNFSYQIMVSHERDITVNKENFDFDSVKKDHIEATDLIQNYLMEIYDSCTFR